MNRKSSIDKLDPRVKELIDELLRDGRHTLDEIKQQISAEYPEAQQPSRSSLGRYSQHIDKIGQRLRESREVAKVWADRLGNEPQGDIGKMVMELLRTLSFDVALEMSEPDEEGKTTLDPKAIGALALAMQRLETAGKFNLQREKEMRAALAEQVTRKLGDNTKGKPRLDKEALDFVRQAIRGDA